MLRADPIPIDIKSERLVGQTKVVLAELAAGNISTHNAKSLMDTVAVEAKIIESEEFERRIQVLEEINRIGIHPDEFVEEPDVIRPLHICLNRYNLHWLGRSHAPAH